eukprot:GSChrysophyteH1.ASY1.ANO1.1360.1 assembled CDS
MLHDLPSVRSWTFASFIGLASVGPYIFICGIYAYHFSARKYRPKLRRDEDSPKDEHIKEWVTALFRPEGITAVVCYMIFGLAVSLLLPEKFSWVVPNSIKTLTLTVHPLSFLACFVVFDMTMWCIHWCQHRFRWLYHNTHAVHHTIQSPTIICALTGFLPDTALLILVPLHVTVLVVPDSNFLTIFLFATLSLFHLHCIHSEFVHSWDSSLRKWGIVNSYDHHVHHLKPRKNLAHFFVIIDKIMGTYEDPITIERILTR